jgi:tetratricopeptide (TPR) repeat protein
MLEFNPESVVLVNEMGCVKYYAGLYEESIRYYRQVLATTPGFALANWGLGRSLTREGKYGEALSVLKKFNAAHGVEVPMILAEIGYVQAVSGDRRAARETIQRLQTMSRTRWVDPYFIAMIHLALHERGETYAWLDKAYIVRSPFLISLATDPKWSAAQGDPRFQTLWNRMTTRRPSDTAARVSTGGS